MDIKEYSTLALRTASPSVDYMNDVMHAAFGIGGEAGEILDHVKKVVWNGRFIDKTHLIAEIGDCMWYLNLLVASLDTDWGHVLSVNIAKLEARYPELKFDAKRSLKRDVKAEKAAMESV